MKLLIGDYHEGKLSGGYHERGDDVPRNILEEIKGRFVQEFRDANIQLTEKQLREAATPEQDIIQAIHALENMDIVLNSSGKYTTEWFELHHPEQSMSWDELAKQELKTPGLAELNASVKNLIETREKIMARIEELMQQELPNVAAVAGTFIGAKLLSAARSRERLAFMPATTVQLLGAEQALFRHLRNKRIAPPKYGILFNHPFVQTVRRECRGRMARALANSISLAARIDHFKGDYAGETLKAKTEAVHRGFART